MIESGAVICCCPSLSPKLALQRWLCLNLLLPGNLRAGQGSLTVYLYSQQNFALMWTEPGTLWFLMLPSSHENPPWSEAEVRGRH